MAGREQLGPYTLEWRDGVFPLGGDSLALGAFATVRPGWRVCDLGTGSGCLMLLLARRAWPLELTGVERCPLAAQDARENLARNGLTGRVLLDDLRTAPLPAGQFDLVVSNPPYFPVGAGKPGSGARSETFCTLEQVVSAAARLCRNGGRFALCHRPERMTDVLCAMRAAGLEPKRVRLLSNRAGRASCLLAEGVRQGRPGLEVSLGLTDQTAGESR